MTADFDRPMPKIERPDDAPAFLLSILAQVEQINADLVRQQERESQDRAGYKEQFAQAARAGKLGADWQAVQQRVDLNQTTLEDVFSGADHTSAARALREAAQAHVAEEREQWERSAHRGEPNPLTEMAELQAATAARLEQLQRLIDSQVQR